MLISLRSCTLYLDYVQRQGWTFVQHVTGLSSDLVYTLLGTYFCTLRYCEGHHNESYNQDHEMSNNCDHHVILRFFQFLYNKYLRLLFEWQPSLSSNFLKSIKTFFIINESVHFSRKYVDPL